MPTVFTRDKTLCPVPPSFTVSRDRSFTNVQVVHAKDKLNVKKRIAKMMRESHRGRLPIRGTMRSGNFTSVSVTGAPVKAQLPMSSITVPPSRIPPWYNEPTLDQQPQTREYGRFFSLERLGEFDTLQSQKLQFMKKGTVGKRKNKKMRTKKFGRVLKAPPKWAKKLDVKIKGW
jgi:hypothetical protein